MKNKKIFGIPALALVLGLLVLGGATAAVLTYFGTVQVTGNVEQAIVVDGNMDTDLGSVTGPLTHNELLTVKNNNNERNVGYTWMRTSPLQASTYLGVYEVSKYTTTSNQGHSTDEELNDFYVEVMPGVDTMTYKIYFSDDYLNNAHANLDLQISPSHSDDVINYHIKYSSDSHLIDGEAINWVFYYESASKTIAVEKGYEAVLARPEVLGLTLNEDDNYVEITVAKTIGEDQSFGVNINDAREYSPGSFDGAKTEGFTYHDTNVAGHIVPNQVNLIGEDVNVVAGGEDKYVFSVFADNGFVDDLFAEVSLKPITFLE